LNGLTPYKEFGKIKLHQWEMFYEQKSTPETIALSQHNSEQAKKNIHPHHLSPKGYGPNMEKWRKEIEDAKAAGVPTIYDNMDEHSMFWLKAREVKDKETGELVILDQRTLSVAQSI